MLSSTSWSIQWLTYWFTYLLASTKSCRSHWILMPGPWYFVGYCLDNISRTWERNKNLYQSQTCSLNSYVLNATVLRSRGGGKLHFLPYRAVTIHPHLPGMKPWCQMLQFWEVKWALGVGHTSCSTNLSLFSIFSPFISCNFAHSDNV